jgi:uncharacterized SAM-binding protein YcdF (DUF218 family)
MTDHAPTAESTPERNSQLTFARDAVENQHRLLPTQAQRLVTGSGAACAALFFLLDTVRFIPILLLALFVIVSGLLALFRHGRAVVKAGLAVVALFSALIVFTPLMDWSVHALDVTVPPEKADVIVILGAGMYCKSGQLDGTSLARLTRGLALWKAGYAPEITVTDADPSIAGPHCPPQGKVTTDFIAALYGDAGPRTTVLPRMRTTRTEAHQVARIQASHGWKRVMVVTSPTHSRRARTIFRDAGVDA